jgi:hypothetical protein
MTEKKATAPKLTDPQVDLLVEAHRSGGTRGIGANYPPAKKLVALELAVFEQQRYGGSRIRLTEAGVQRALQETQADEEANPVPPGM